MPEEGFRTTTDLNHLLQFSRYAMFKVMIDGPDSRILKRRWQRLTILAPSSSQQQEEQDLAGAGGDPDPDEEFEE